MPCSSNSKIKLRAVPTTRTVPRRHSKPRLVLVTPAFAEANNGNWQTAKRWARWLANDYEVRLAAAWDRDETVIGDDDVMLALHARRCAASIEAFAKAHPDRALIVALTGTDLYGDVARGDASALRSLELATRLIVLQEAAPEAVPPSLRHKVDVCFQSTPERQRLAKTSARLRALAVGHLRAVKDPLTVMRAMARLDHRRDIALDHVGDALDAALADAARACMRAHPRYRWLGGIDHAKTLARIQRAHVLVHASVMEGGAHVVMEAVRCGTPVIASRMPGNVGMLGREYAGYFAVGDDAALAHLLERARDEPAWLERLNAQAVKRSTLFAPEREARVLRAIVRAAAKSVGLEPLRA
jgi:putative glycosyltransferase (TIGR04348 family)